MGYARTCYVTKSGEDLRSTSKRAETFGLPDSVVCEQVMHNLGIVSSVRTVRIADGQPANLFNVFETCNPVFHAVPHDYGL